MNLKEPNILNPRARKRIAIVVEGGQAPMFTFEQASDLHCKVAAPSGKRAPGGRYAGSLRRLT